MSAKGTKLPVPTVQRFPAYLRILKKMMAAGMNYVSGESIADMLGLDGVLTRKDLAMTGIAGRPRLGYPAKELGDAIIRELGWNHETRAALIGVGSLGSALLGHTGFAEQNLTITAAFDSDEALIGRTIHGVEVRPMSDLANTVKAKKIHIGILTVPSEAAQQCADAFVSAGVRGILNFTTVYLDVPDRVKVQNVDLAQSLALLSHSIDTADAVRRSDRKEHKE